MGTGSGVLMMALSLEEKGSHMRSRAVSLINHMPMSEIYLHAYARVCVCVCVRRTCLHMHGVCTLETDLQAYAQGSALVQNYALVHSSALGVHLVA